MNNPQFILSDAFPKIPSFNKYITMGADQIWNFLLPGEGSHTFRWTGSNAFLDNTNALLIHKHPNFAMKFKGADLFLSRKKTAKQSAINRWELFVDGRKIEEVSLSKEGARDLKSLGEGSYQIATHFTPSETKQQPNAIWMFLVRGKEHTVTVFHNQISGRVELALDGNVECGRTSKMLDNGMLLEFQISRTGILCTCSVKPSMLSFKYLLMVNRVTIEPSFYKKKQNNKVNPVEVLTAAQLEEPEVRERRNSSIGFNKNLIESLPSKSESEIKEHEYKLKAREDAEKSAAAQRPESEQNRKDFSPSWGNEEKNSSDEEVKKEERGESKRGEDLDFKREKQNQTQNQNENNTKTSSSSSYDDYEPILPRGVTYIQGENLFQAGMMVKGRFLNLGKFEAVEEAACAFQRGSDRFRTTNANKN